MGTQGHCTGDEQPDSTPKDRWSSQGKTKTGRRRIGRYRRAEYVAWLDMIRRCSDPTSSNWKHYGGRGLTVCQRWLESFYAFYEDVGPRPGPGFTLDREDNSGNYEPGNVRWATWSQQLSNRRSFKRPRRLLTLDGLTRSVAEWSRILGVSRFALYHRLNKAEGR